MLTVFGAGDGPRQDVTLGCQTLPLGILEAVPSLRIILVRPKEPANVGSSARAMKNFGLSELFLVAPQRRVDRSPNSPAYALASHAGDVLDNATHCDTLAEAVAGLKLVLGTTARPRAAEGQKVYTLRAAAQALPAEGVGVVFGPEDFGLSNDDLAHCQGYIQIPTAAYASLNLAQAVGVVAYEWFTTHAEATQAPDLTDLAPRDELEPFYSQLLETLHLIGYTDAQRSASADRLFRGVFDRAGLSSREVLALRGLCRQIVWAVRKGSGE